MTGFIRRLLSPPPPPPTNGELIERYLYLTGELPGVKPGTPLTRGLLEILVKRAEDVQAGRLRK